MKTKIQIDRSNWRTGFYGKNQTGNDITLLKNESGYKCCLGFICEHFIGDSILNISTPRELKIDIPDLTSTKNNLFWENTTLAHEAMGINDHEITTPQEKEQLLLELFKDSCYELEFIGEYNANS